MLIFALRTGRVMLTRSAWFQIVKVVPNSKRLEELILNSACAIIYALHFFKSYSWCVKTARM